MEKQELEWWKQRSHRLLGMGIGITVFTLTLMGMYATHMLFGWNILFDVLRICNMWMQAHRWFSVSHMLEGLVICTFVLFIGYALDQCYRSYRAARRCRALENRTLSDQFNGRYRPGRKHTFMIVRHAEPLAFTMGIVHRRIILSEGLLHLLDEEELEAVVHHELFHYDHHDPLKTFLLTQAAFALWFLPMLRGVAAHYKISREVLADHAAIQQLGTPAGIGGALLKLIHRSRTPMQLPAGLIYSSFAETSLNYRIHRIIEPDNRHSPRLALWSVVISLMVLTVLSILLLWSLI